MKHRVLQFLPSSLSSCDILWKQSTLLWQWISYRYYWGLSRFWHTYKPPSNYQDFWGYWAICIAPIGSSDLPVVILLSCGQCTLRWSGQTRTHSFFSSMSYLIIRCSSFPMQCSLERCRGFSQTRTKGHVWDSSVFFTTVLGRWRLSTNGEGEQEHSKFKASLHAANTALVCETEPRCGCIAQGGCAHTLKIPWYCNITDI